MSFGYVGGGTTGGGGGDSSSASVQYSQSQNSEFVPEDQQPFRKQSESNYLKLLLECINANLEDVLGPGKDPLTLKDLDKLSSETMQQILTFIVKESGFDFGLEEAHGVGGMNLINDLGIMEPVYFDCTVDNLYRTVRRFFNPQDEVFDYSVIYFPDADPKRTKQSLAYLTYFIFFTGSLMERFVGVAENVNKEAGQKAELVLTLDDVKRMLNEEIIRIENRKAQLPEFIAENEVLDENIAQVQDKIEGLELQMKEHKGGYEKIEQEVKALEGKLGAIEEEKEALSQQIVSHPELALRNRQDVKAKLDALYSERDELQQQIDRHRRSNDDREDLIDELAKCRKELQEHSWEMQRIIDTAEDLERVDLDVIAAKAQIRTLKERLDILEVEKKTQLETFRGKEEMIDGELQATASTNEHKQMALGQLKSRMVENAQRIVLIKDKLNKLALEKEQINEDIKIETTYLEVDGPNEIIEIAAQMESTITEAANEVERIFDDFQQINLGVNPNPNP